MRASPTRRPRPAAAPGGLAGFVGWRPGELGAELEAGFWYTADPDAALIFSDDTRTMWEALMQRLGKRQPPGEGMQEA